MDDNIAEISAENYLKELQDLSIPKDKYIDTLSYMKSNNVYDMKRAAQAVGALSVEPAKNTNELTERFKAHFKEARESNDLEEVAERPVIKSREELEAKLHEAIYGKTGEEA